MLDRRQMSGDNERGMIECNGNRPGSSHTHIKVLVPRKRDATLWLHDIARRRTIARETLSDRCENEKGGCDVRLLMHSHAYSCPRLVTATSQPLFFFSSLLCFR